MNDLWVVIYSWGHRYWLEVGLTGLCFLVIHFIGYPFITRKYELSEKLSPAASIAVPAPKSQQPSPAISTGDITTYGNNSGVTIGATDGKKSKKTTEESK